MKGFKPSLVCLALSIAMGAQANSLDSARTVENKINKASAVSQTKIDKSAEAALTMQAEIEQLQEEVKNLTVYRDHMARLVANQEQESASLTDQIQGIKDTRQGVVPLMYKMIDGLKVIIAQDKPIKRDQRLARIAKLELMMSQADISDAEKYRRILESYQIEMDYGTKLGVYQGELALTSSDTIEAELLYLGRISLVARSLDGKRYWTWNDQDAGWQALDSQFSSGVDKAFAIANKQVAPSLINLPVSLQATTNNVETK
ncbi:DUF3450 domain-containing protein [Photobacterium sanguinicancri]|uniref:DUF3450 domain-containing protein n=1 Tax=Photobacterium sanguinicancri TaxID=875932 RepID=UPI0026E48FC7|nr:DUF3450 domain-containing protein [Photobacterium sanguinicancri]MDO6498981.1 DUF3450 domain-containing protein [Photobacterium sanguinicancri]